MHISDKHLNTSDVPGALWGNSASISFSPQVKKSCCRSHMIQRRKLGLWGSWRVSWGWSRTDQGQESGYLIPGPLFSLLGRGHTGGGKLAGKCNISDSKKWPKVNIKAYFHEGHMQSFSARGTQRWYKYFNSLDIIAL